LSTVTQPERGRTGQCPEVCTLPSPVLLAPLHIEVQVSEEWRQVHDPGLAL
jgi:hypothetical protein